MSMIVSPSERDLLFPLDVYVMVALCIFHLYGAKLCSSSEINSIYA